MYTPYGREEREISITFIRLRSHFVAFPAGVGVPPCTAFGCFLLRLLNAACPRREATVLVGPIISRALVVEVEFRETAVGFRDRFLAVADLSTSRRSWVSLFIFFKIVYAAFFRKLAFYECATESWRDGCLRYRRVLPVLCALRSTCCNDAMSCSRRPTGIARHRRCGFHG